MALRWTRELKSLLAECDVKPYKASGPGGQHRNKAETAVRVRHRATGIVRVGTQSRSQSANKLHALAKIAEDLARRSQKPKPRTATKPTAAARRRRIENKKKRGGVKRLRRAPSED